TRPGPQGSRTLGAEEGTRTPTPLRAHGPEPCASANSATSARTNFPQAVTRGKSAAAALRTAPREAFSSIDFRQAGINLSNCDGLTFHHGGRFLRPRPSHATTRRDRRNKLPPPAWCSLPVNLDVQEVNAYAHRLMRGGSTAIALDHKGRIICVATRGANAPPLGTPLDPFRGLSGACVRIGQTQVCDEVDSDTRVDLPVCRSLGVRSMVFVPLRTTNEVLGVLAAFSDQPRHFREPQVFLLELLARVVAESCAGMHPEPWLKPAPRPQLEMAEVRLFETAQQHEGGGRS